MATFSVLQRDTITHSLSTEQFDLLVIGGGATGCGIALDAASRGLKTALIEKYDFASGTSSRSTKLIHGGLRYLKQLEFSLVSEVGRERAIVHKLAPHLVVPEKMLLPLTKTGSYGRFSTSMGLWLYDILANVQSEDQRVMLNTDETIEKEPLLQRDNVTGGGFYAEYRTDDARLTLEVIKTAVNQHDACAINYCEAKGFIHEDGKLTGITCYDRIAEKNFPIQAKYIVSATGPWVDTMRAKNNSLNHKRLHLTKGVHIVVPHDRLPVKQSIYFDVPDGRMIFAIPRGKVTYVGTTDTDYHGDLDHIITLQKDAQYLVDGVNNTFPDVNLSIEDVESSWAGLRPLIHEEGKSASELSRKDEIFQAKDGLISIAGGKLTGYRKMAQRIVDLVAKKLKQEHQRKAGPCITDEIVLEGGDFKNYKKVKNYVDKIAEQLAKVGLERYHAAYLVGNYGRQTKSILALATFNEAEEAELSLAKAELKFGIEQEMVHTPRDFFTRRTGRMYFDIGSVRRLLPQVMPLFQTLMNWNDEEAKIKQQEVEQECYELSHFPIEEPTKAVG